MANHTTSLNHQCFSVPIMMPLSIILSLTASPFHILIMKVLIQRFRLTLPRHTILLCLSISDNFQLLCATLIIAAGKAAQPSITSLTCQVMRQTMEVLTIMSHCASSGCIIALSVERYIACVFSLRLHAIVTSERVTRVLISIGVVSILLGLLAIHPQTPNYSQNVISNDERSMLIIIITVCLSSVILAITQIRLYGITRLKIKVTPHQILHGAHKERQDLTRHQKKLGIAASVVVILYVACMSPGACLFVYILVHPNKDVGQIKPFFAVLALANVIADPIVYGFGMADVRKGIKKEFSKLKSRLFSCGENA